MMPTKEEWKQIENRLSGAYGSVILLVDGYEIRLNVERIKSLKYAIIIYINGWLRGEWLFADCEERRRFYNNQKRYVYKPRARRSMEEWNKKHPGATMGNPYRTIDVYTPYWASFTRLKRHLIKNNTNIEMVKGKEVPDVGSST